MVGICGYSIRQFHGPRSCTNLPASPSILHEPAGITRDLCTSADSGDFCEVRGKHHRFESGENDNCPVACRTMTDSIRRLTQGLLPA